MSARSKPHRSNSEENRNLYRFDRGSIDILRHCSTLNEAMNISVQVLFFALLELFSLHLSNNDKSKADYLFQAQLVILQISQVLPSSMIESARKIRLTEPFQHYVKVLDEAMKTAFKLVENQNKSSDQKLNVAKFLNKEFPSALIPNKTTNSIRIDIPQQDLQLRVALPLNDDRTLAIKSYKNIVINRYVQDFDEVRKIGRGAFGSVFMAKNRLDDRAYAIKKIIFNENSDQTRRRAQLALQEVRILASLTHPNIVQYHCAWLELVPMGNQIRSTNSSEDLGKKIVERKENDSLDKMIEFRSSAQNSIDRGNETNEKSISSSSSVNREDEQLEASEEKENRSSFDESSSESSYFESKSSHEKEKSSSSTNSEKSSPNQALVPFQYHNSMISSGERKFYMDARLVLFIQMQICDRTLYDWLRFRDKKIADDLIQSGSKFINILSEIKQRQCWQIYKQILSAVMYLHSQSFVHRDVKPKNIFISGDPYDSNCVNVKLGDFGLATLTESETTKTTSQIEEGGVVGTALYAAPEQLNPRGCSITCKADSYSLGVVLFELFNVYRTEMERIHCLTELRIRQRVDEDFLGNYPLESEIINELVLLDVSKRPSIGEILGKFHREIQRKNQKFSLNDKKILIEQLREVLRGKDERIRHLESEIKNLSS